MDPATATLWLELKRLLGALDADPAVSEQVRRAVRRLVKAIEKEVRQ